MRTALIIIALFLSVTCLAQFKKKSPEPVLKPIIEPEYVDIIGATRAEFAEWAKEKGVWDLGHVEKNSDQRIVDNKGDTVVRTWDERFIGVGSNQRIGHAQYRLNYAYYFKDDRLFQIQIRPISGYDVPEEVGKYYTFTKQDDENWFWYESKDNRYSVLFLKQVEDSGFEEKVHYSKLTVLLN